MHVYDDGPSWLPPPPNRGTLLAGLLGDVSLSRLARLQSRFFVVFFLSHCWCKYLNKIFVFSVVITCSAGWSFVQMYTEGRLILGLQPESA